MISARYLRKLFFDYLPAVVKTGIAGGAPSLYGMFEIKPTSCSLMLTNRCNSRCVMCRQWKTPPGNEFSTKQWKGALDELRVNGIHNIHYTGGEPLLRKDLTELVRYASGKGFVVGLTTNGLLVDTAILDGLVDAGLRSIVISLDALGEDYERVRGAPNLFSKAKAAAYLISEAKRKRGIDASINYTLMKETIKSFGDVMRFAEELDLAVAICLLDKNSYIFDVVENDSKFWIDEPGELNEFLGFAKKRMIERPQALLLNFPALDYLSRYFKDPRQERIPCVSSQDRIIIDPSGNLLGGCLSMGNFGNVGQTALKVLLQDKRYKQAKKRMFYKKCRGCSCGYLFNIRCMPTLLMRDLLSRVWYAAREKR